MKFKCILLIAVCAILQAAQADDDMSTFFVGRLKFSNNSGDDCGDVGRDLINLVSRASTIKVKEQKPVTLTDSTLFETPFLFMNGHNDFVLSSTELENLSIYLSHGGFILASGCCTNPEFPAAWRREFSRIFPGEKVKPIPYDHLIYRSFYKIDRIRAVDENRDIHLEGLFYQGNLVAVLCEDGLCCSFAMENNCNKGKGITPEEGKKIALNIAVYALTH
ncbi:MAG: DUF4159 domain-containing protein [Verrucomicrobiota bacterium]